jgi:hypothetical protein
MSRAAAKKLNGNSITDRKRTHTKTVTSPIDLPRAKYASTTSPCGSGWYVRSTGYPNNHSGDQQSRGFSPRSTACTILSTSVKWRTLSFRSTRLMEISGQRPAAFATRTASKKADASRFSRERFMWGAIGRGVRPAWRATAQ